MAAVTEVNGAGIMLFGCGLLATLQYLPICVGIWLKYNTISAWLVRPGRQPTVCPRR